MARTCAGWAIAVAVAAPVQGRRAGDQRIVRLGRQGAGGAMRRSRAVSQGDSGDSRNRGCRAAARLRRCVGVQHAHADRLSCAVAVAPLAASSSRPGAQARCCVFVMQQPLQGNSHEMNTRSTCSCHVLAGCRRAGHRECRPTGFAARRKRIHRHVPPIDCRAAFTDRATGLFASGGPANPTAFRRARHGAEQAFAAPSMAGVFAVACQAAGTFCDTIADVGAAYQALRNIGTMDSVVNANGTSSRFISRSPW